MKPSSFVAITSEGGLLPADFLAELLAPKSAIEGLEPAAYNLAEGERINEQVNRSWNRLKGRWADFKKAVANKQPGESTTTETRDRWLQPIFQELGFGQRRPLTPPIEIDGRSYPVSHGWNHVPIHLVGSHVDLDHRSPGTTGAAKHSPHSLVQQVLNASDERLWGIVSNGLTFRLLRDNVALTRLSLVEWDLAAIFDGELYSEFFLLWLVAHQSRFDAERPAQCWLEQWRKLAQDKGLRALEQLRPGVARAIEALGAGLVSHPANQRLRARLSRGELSTQDFYRQVLRVVYRLLFLFVAEDRGLLHPPLPKDDPDGEAAALQARGRYRDCYSVTRLRNLTLHRAGTPHPDLWHVFQLVSRQLGSGDGCPALALPALGSFLWEAGRSTPDLTDALVSNRHFLTAVHAVAFVQDGSVRRPINYKNLGSEELGSVYEGLLELHPRINADTGQFELNIAAGNERKTTGSYYTPDSLVQCLLDSALEPVVAEAMRGKDGPAAADAILKLKVCDPAVGSGHFLIAAAHRIAKRLAASRSGEEEPSPAVYRTALRDVIGHCLYGVDINPMSAELCRVSLWMEALEPGKPLSFLEHHIQVGNSLLGTTPALLANGIPDDAFTAIEGDVKTRVTQLKKQNKREREEYKSGQGYLFEPHFKFGNLAADFARLNTAPDGTLAEVSALSEQYAQLIRSSDYEATRLLADTWCAAFVWKKDDSDLGKRCPTERDFRKVESDAVAGLLPHVRAEVERLRDQYQFFHWHLAFPDVFRLPGKDEKPESEETGWSGGFDVVLGNPPYGAPFDRSSRFILKLRFPDASETSNSAADFVAFSRDLIRANGKVGLVIPKSFSYSNSWDDLRLAVGPSLSDVIDVSQAWENVLLEQLLITYERRSHGSAKKAGVRLGRMHSAGQLVCAIRPAEIITELSIVPTGLSDSDLECLTALSRRTTSRLSDVCSTQRGTGLQRYLNSVGEIPVIGGKDIADFALRKVTRFVEVSVLNAVPVRMTDPPQPVFQNIVAHITRPSDHIRLIGAVATTRIACLDTVNLLQSERLPAWALTAFLSSNFINWFVYVCVYNRAVRTMHFDGYVLQKIPFTDQLRIDELNDAGRKVVEDPRCEALWRRINALVYDAFDVPHRHREIVDSTHQPRWL